MLGWTRLALDACREERRFGAVVIPAISLSGGCCVLKTYIVLGDELHELRSRMGNDTVCVFAGLVVYSLHAVSPDCLHEGVTIGVKASDTETIRQSDAVATSAT